jgi:RNA polymerase sigma-70 factor (ECF subfamily)
VVEDAPLDAVIAAARTRWPALAVDAAQLTAALDERGLAPGALYAADVALAIALAHGDPPALAIFDTQIVPDITHGLRRLARDADFLAEAVQRVRVKLLVGEPARIAEYRGRGPLAAWVQIVAIREALMMQRATRKEDSDDGVLVDLALSEPAFAQTRQRHKEVFATAFRAALHELDERERLLLRMCFLERAGADDIARLFGVHRVTSFRWLRDARQKLLELTRARFLEALPIPASEVDSVMRSLATSLTVSW